MEIDNKLFAENKKLIDDIGFQIKLPLTNDQIEYVLNLSTEKNLRISQESLGTTRPKKFRKQLLQSMEDFEKEFTKYMTSVREKLNDKSSVSRRPRYSARFKK